MSVYLHVQEINPWSLLIFYFYLLFYIILYYSMLHEHEDHDHDHVIIVCTINNCTYNYFPSIKGFLLKFQKVYKMDWINEKESGKNSVGRPTKTYAEGEKPK